MNPKTCDVCGKVFSSKFCPDCGRKYEDVVVNIPTTITVYAHGDKENGYDKCTKYNIDPKSELGKSVIYAAYEVKIIYEIVGDKLVARQVDVGDGQGLCKLVPIKK